MSLQKEEKYYKEASQEHVEKINRKRNMGDVDLVELLYRLIEKLKYIVLAAVIGAVVAGVYTSQFVTPMYRSTSKIYIANTDKTMLSISDLQLGSYLASDYLEVFSMRQLRQSVEDFLGPVNSQALLGSTVSAKNPDGTRMIYITVSSASAKDAMTVTNAYADVVCTFIAEKMKVEKPTVLEYGNLPTAPSSPNMFQNVMIGFVLGAALICAIITIHLITDDRIKTTEEIARYFDLPILGILTIQDSTKSSKKPRFFQRLFVRKKRK